MRRLAVELRIPFRTTMAAATAAVRAIRYAAIPNEPCQVPLPPQPRL